VNLERALKIDGWMEPHDLEWLAEKAMSHVRIVEIGCWMGRSTRVLADNTLGIVVAVDHWNGSEEHQSMFVNNSLDWVWNIFEKNLSDHISRGKVFPMRMDSRQAAYHFAATQTRFDMVFIDASHDYDSFKQDVELWRPLCDGLLCGHDGGHGPIMKALAEIVPNYHHEHSMWVA